MTMICKPHAIGKKEQWEAPLTQLATQMARTKSHCSISYVLTVMTRLKLKSFSYSTIGRSYGGGNHHIFLFLRNFAFAQFIAFYDFYGKKLISYVQHIFY
jgi:hypothetical protein